VFSGRGAPLYGGKPEAQPGIFPQASAFNLDLDRAKTLSRTPGMRKGFDTSLLYSAARGVFRSTVACDP